MASYYRALLLLLIKPCFALNASVVIRATNYDYWCVGNCNKDVTPTTKTAIVLMGGGTDVDDAFKKQIDYSANGDFLVLRTTGDDAYNDYIYGLGRSNSVATLLLKNKQASSESFVLGKIKAAEAIFMAGGDQFTYVSYWQDTPLNDALITLVQKNVPFGGTSAGCAVLGNFIYTAAQDTVLSTEALTDPYNFRVTLGKQFLPFGNLVHSITDPHFKTRDRMGRLVAFVARLIQDKWDSKAYGIGIDEKTALFVEANGMASILGSGTAYIVINSSAPSVCQKSTPLTFEGLTVAKLDAARKDTFDFTTLKGGRTYPLDVRKGAFVQRDPYGG